MSPGSVAFTVVINPQFIVMAVCVLIAVFAFMMIKGSDYDRELAEIKGFKLMASYVLAPVIVILGVIVSLILWAVGANKVFAEIDIFMYAIMIVSGMIVAIVLGLIMAKKKGISFDIIVDLALVIIPLGIIGARLWFIAFEYDTGGHNFESFWDFFNLRGGGLGIYGGVIFGAIGVIIVSKWKKIPMLKLLDLVAPCVMIAQAIGRWGNFFNEEAHGFQIYNEALQWFPFCVNIGGKWFLATFFYEFLWNTIGFAVLYWYMYSRNKIDGFGVCAYFIWYGLGRSWIESLRTDSLFIPGTGIRVSILFSIIMIVAAGALLGYLIYKHINNKKLAAIEGEENKEESDEE